MNNIDHEVVRDFGREWGRFPQKQVDHSERLEGFNEYFHIFPWSSLDASKAVGADIGCGSGRWAMIVKDRVRELHLVDASSQALGVAKENLRDSPHIRFHLASVGDIPLAQASLDFVYCLGVLHHVPDTRLGIREIARILKPGGVFLGYLYYRFDNRPIWFQGLWRISDLVRRAVCRMPSFMKHALSELIAAVVYWPLARAAMVLDKLKLLPDSWPLANYRHKSFYSMRTDALDRFGTRLEKRFTQKEIIQILTEEGFDQIRFSEGVPHWTFVCNRKTAVE